MTTPQIIIDLAGKSWTCGEDEGYIERFMGNWIASHADDAGERNATEGYSRVSPEDAVTMLLEERDARAAAEALNDPYDYYGER